MGHDEGLTLERRVDGQLWAMRSGQATAVRVVRCFPWSSPGCFLSLRDEEDEEVALVPSPGDLDTESRVALDEAMVEAGFVLEVLGIESVEEDYEIRCWSVRTAQGRRSFQTPLDTWPRLAPGGGLLVEDVAGDLFWIPPVERLDAASRRELWAFVD